MPAAGVVTIALIVLIVLALVYYLLSTILELRKINQGLDEVIASVGEIVEKSAPVNDVVNDINANLDAAVSALEGLLVKKAGMRDARRPGRRALPGRRRRRASATSPRAARSRRRGSPRSTRAGTLTLARLGREAPIAMANPGGPVLRNTEYGSAAARALYTGERPARSPVIGTDAPVQYEQREDTGRPRRRFKPTMGGT